MHIRTDATLYDGYVVVIQMASALLIQEQTSALTFKGWQVHYYEVCVLLENFSLLTNMKRRGTVKLLDSPCVCAWVLSIF